MSTFAVTPAEPPPHQDEESLNASAYPNPRVASRLCGGLIQTCGLSAVVAMSTVAVGRSIPYSSSSPARGVTQFRLVVSFYVRLHFWTELFVDSIQLRQRLLLTEHGQPTVGCEQIMQLAGVRRPVGKMFARLLYSGKGLGIADPSQCETTRRQFQPRRRRFLAVAENGLDPLDQGRDRLRTAPLPEPFRRIESVAKVALQVSDSSLFRRSVLVLLVPLRICFRNSGIRSGCDAI